MKYLSKSFSGKIIMGEQGSHQTGHELLKRQKFLRKHNGFWGKTMGFDEKQCFWGKTKVFAESQRFLRKNNVFEEKQCFWGKTKVFEENSVSEKKKQWFLRKNNGFWGKTMVLKEISPDRLYSRGFVAPQLTSHFQPGIRGI